MSLKVKKFNQGATEMFISEFEIEFWNVMSKIYKNSIAKKANFKDFLESLEMSGN